MFEFLEGNFYKNDDFEGEVVGFNKETNKLIFNGVDKNDNVKSIEVNIFDAGITHNINYYDDWEHKLYTALLRNKGYVNIDILSTESGDNWNIEIYRNKTLLNVGEYDEPIILLSYVTVFSGEVKGKVLSFQYKKYSGCEIDDEKKFTEWINEQIENISEFNNTEYWNTIDAIIISEAFNSKEEISLLWNMFNKDEEKSSIIIEQN